MVITLEYLFLLILTLILTAITLFVESRFMADKFSAKTLRTVRNILLVFIVALIVYLCISNFPISLTLLVIFTGIIALIDQLFFARKRKRNNEKPGSIVENARSFFPVLLIVWLIRSFIIQPYQVPSGSLEPTVVPGDFIAVNQFAYGLRFPIGNFKMMNVAEPKIGDIVLFYNPVNPSLVFVKRMIGGPGDHIVYKNKTLYVNGKVAKQSLINGTAEDVEPDMIPISVELRSENLNGIKHNIYVRPFGGEMQDFDIIVPQDMYFMMGDNRDDSDDSRTGFGSGVLTFVPEQNLIGKALGIWMSWDSTDHRIRWKRIGKALH